MSIEDNICAMPTLRQRAVTALETAETVRDTREADIIEELRYQAYHWLKDVLLVDDGAAVCAMNDANQGLLNSNKIDRAPDEPAPNLCLTVKVDGETLRFHFVKVKAFSLGASLDKEFASETIYDSVLTCEWRSPGMTYYKITDLAVLGQMVAEHVR